MVRVVVVKHLLEPHLALWDPKQRADAAAPACTFSVAHPNHAHATRKNDEHLLRIHEVTVVLARNEAIAKAERYLKEIGSLNLQLDDLNRILATQRMRVTSGDIGRQLLGNSTVPQALAHDQSPNGHGHLTAG
jgi:hypothetical protein